MPRQGQRAHCLSPALLLLAVAMLAGVGADRDIGAIDGRGQDTLHRQAQPQRLSPSPISSSVSSSSTDPTPCNTSLLLGFYTLKCDAKGNIVTPWTSLQQAMAMEVEWYLAAPPASHGYPTYAYSTFVDGNRT